MFQFSSPLAMLPAGLGSPTVRLRSTSAIRVSAWHNSSKTFKMTPKEIVGKFVWLQVKRESFPCFFFKRNWKVYEIYRVLVIVLVLIFLPRVDDGTSSRPVFNWSTTEVLAWKDEGEFQPNNFLMALKFCSCSLVTDFYFDALIFCANFENVIGHWYWFSCLPWEALSFCLKQAREVAFLLTYCSKQAEYNLQIMFSSREKKLKFDQNHRKRWEHNCEDNYCFWDYLASNKTMRDPKKLVVGGF